MAGRFATLYSGRQKDRSGRKRKLSLIPTLVQPEV